MTEFVTNSLSFLTVAADVLIIAGVVAFIMLSTSARETITPLVEFVRDRAVLLSFIVALVATLGSLFYSEIAGYEPCKLCWFQRILMYPQVIILGIAIAMRDKSVLIYSFWLSIVGAIIAGYHYLLQIGVASGISCGAVGYSASCSQRFVLQLGYITIPMMALSAFVLIAMITAGALYIKPKNIWKDNS